MCLVLAGAGVWALAPPADATAEASTAAAGVTLVDTERIGRQEDLTLYSPALDSETHVRVLLPSDYDGSGESYPVVYMLHGLDGTWRDWVEQIGADTITEPYDAIFVMPDADGGFYADFHNRGAYGPPAYEKYHVEELLSFIRSRYRTDPAASAVVGRSFGGFGSMSYAARHPDIFRVAVSFSGMVDTLFAPPITELGLAAFYEAALGPKPDVFFGDPMRHNLLWRARNPASIASNLANTSVYLEWGNGVPRFMPVNPADVFIEIFIDIENRSFSRTLAALGIDHVRIARQGAHQWQEYIGALTDALPVVMAELDAQRTPPAEFDYDTIDTEFEIWDWEFSVGRRAPEFLELDDVSTSGLEIEGSGRVDVTTAPAYCPGETYEVAGADEKSVVAGADGTLEFTVDLGPSSAHEQFSIEDRLWQLFGRRRPRTTVPVSIIGCTQ